VGGVLSDQDHLPNVKICCPVKGKRCATLSAFIETLNTERKNQRDCSGFSSKQPVYRDQSSACWSLSLPGGGVMTSRHAAAAAAGARDVIDAAGCDGAYETAGVTRHSAPPLCRRRRAPENPYTVIQSACLKRATRPALTVIVYVLVTVGYV